MTTEGAERQRAEASTFFIMARTLAAVLVILLLEQQFVVFLQFVKITGLHCFLLLLVFDYHMKP